MRILAWLAAAVLASAAAGEARAQAKFDPLCSVKTTSLDERIANCTRFINRTPLAYATGPYVADAYATRGQAWSDKADCQRAINDVNIAISYTAKYKEPPVRKLHYQYHFSAAYVHLNCSGDFDAALGVLERASRLKPEEPSYAIAGRALMFSEKGDFKSAHAEMARAIPLVHGNEERSQVLAARAVILDRQGRRDEAMNDFDEAIRLNPRHAIAYADRGNIWRLRGDLARALTDLNIAVRLEAHNPTILARRGEVLRYRGELAEALGDFNKALALNPYAVQALTGRGLIHEKLGDRARARSDFEGALASPLGNTTRIREARETASARLAALDSGQAAPTIPAAPARVASPTSVPTPALVAPILTKPVVAEQAVARQGRRVALVVGNSAYRRVPELINPRNDANAVAAALRNVGFDTVVQVADTTRERLADVLRTFATEAAKADWAMVYYAGHGIEVNGRNYLLPVDARLAADRDVASEAVPLDAVMASLAGASKLKLVVLDACRDNPFAPQMQRTMTVADAGASVPTVGGSAASRSIGRGLGEVRVSGASLVVFAAKHGQTALDGEGGNSPFAIALVQRIATPGVEINKIFRLVRDDVMEATAGRQEPFTYGSLPGREDFFFVAGR
jgi:tetratricopeptide (TPR) repeat protein